VAVNHCMLRIWDQNNILELIVSNRKAAGLLPFVLDQIVEIGIGHVSGIKVGPL
jgi:hypothetical protein